MWEGVPLSIIHFLVENVMQIFDLVYHRDLHHDEYLGGGGCMIRTGARRLPRVPRGALSPPAKRGSLISNSKQ